MTKKELWQRFIKTGRVSDYLAYTKAQQSAFQPEAMPQDLSTEFAEAFFDLNAPAQRKDENDHDLSDGRDRHP